MAAASGAVYDAAKTAEAETGGALKIRPVSEGRGWEISILDGEQGFTILMMKDNIVDALVERARGLPSMTESHLHMLRMIAEAAEADLAG